MMTATEATSGILALPLVDLNRDRREERQRILCRSRRHSAAILAVALAAGVVLVPLTMQVVTLHIKLLRSEEQAKEARSRLQSMTSASARMDERISVWERLVQTQQSRRAWGVTFPTLAACLPQDVFLQQVQITGNDKDAEIQLQGSARTMMGLRAFTTSLAKSPMFARVHLDEAAADHAAGHRSLAFRLTGPIATGAVAP